MTVYDLWRTGHREDGDVNGHPASVEDMGGEAYVVTWSPSPGQLIEVLTNGVPASAALDAARAVRPATAEEWADLQGRVPAPPAVDPAEAVGVEHAPSDAAHRPLADGTTEVWGWLGEGGGPCYQVANGEGGESRLCTDDPAARVRGVSPTSTNGGPMVTIPAAVGIAPPETASIDGAAVTFGEDVARGRVFVCEFRDGAMPATITFRDADGAQLDTAEVVVI